MGIITNSAFSIEIHSLFSETLHIIVFHLSMLAFTHKTTVKYIINKRVVFHKDLKTFEKLQSNLFVLIFVLSIHERIIKTKIIQQSKTKINSRIKKIFYRQNT